jgi:mono/diheme cytochrome c family protein
MPQISITRTLAALVFFTTALSACSTPETKTAEAATSPAEVSSDEPHTVAVSAIAAGRYITEIGGCNDCHTSGYMEAGGNMPDSLRLMGDAMGIRGPWGTSYPANLRLTVQRMSADEFVTMVRARNGLPPMPWPSLHKMNEQDLRAIYAYIKSLGGRGQPAPAAVPPNVEPKTPYVLFEPTFPKGMKPVAP